MPRHLDDRKLHAETDAEIGHFAHASITRGLDLALGPPFAEAAGHDDAVDILKMRAGIALFEQLEVDPVDIDAHALGNAAMGERLDQRFIGVLEDRVLAHDSDRNLAIGMGDAVRNLPPHVELRRRCAVDAEGCQHLAVEPFLVVRQRHIVDVGHIERLYHGTFAHVTEQRNLGALALGHRFLGAAKQDIGLDADRAQLLDRVLRRLGLKLARGLHPGQQGQVDEDHVPARQLVADMTMASKNGRSSMSPTVPPISTRTKSASSLPVRTNSLMALVTCGTTWTVPPR